MKIYSTGKSLFFAKDQKEANIKAKKMGYNVLPKKVKPDIETNSQSKVRRAIW